MGTHEKLDVWKLSIDFVTHIYKITQSFAEGAARQSDKENIQFLYISLGSLSELETQLIISQNLDYFDSKETLSELRTIKSKLVNYIKYLKTLK